MTSNNEVHEKATLKKSPLLECGAPWNLSSFPIFYHIQWDYRENYTCWLYSSDDIVSAWRRVHYDDVIMGAMASQITSLPLVYSTVYSDADQRKHQSSASLAFVRGIHRGPVNSPHKWPVTRKMFPFHDIIMDFPGIFSVTKKKRESLMITFIWCNKLSGIRVDSNWV